MQKPNDREQTKFQTIGVVRWVVLLILLATTLTSNRAAAIEQDKLQHGAVSAALGTTCSTIANLLTNDIWIAGVGCFLLVNAIGVAKELADPSLGGVRDMKDIFANMAGSGIAVTAVSLSFGVYRQLTPDIRPAAKAIEPPLNEREQPFSAEITRFQVIDGVIQETTL